MTDNLSGEVTMYRYDNAGTKLCTLKYDAWGNSTISYETGVASSTKWFLNDHCVFRYRGYYYDAETGFYYLESRYYNPTWGRFINADGYINANGDILGFNMFAYCSNSPIIHVDEDGYRSKLIAWLISKFHMIGGAGTGGWSNNGAKNASIIESSMGAAANNAGNNSGGKNVGGRHGGLEHQQQIQAIKGALAEAGWTVSKKEMRATYDNPKYRYPDITAEIGTQKIFVQVGKVNGLGFPATREIKALVDLSEIQGAEIYFIPYNK